MHQNDGVKKSGGVKKMEMWRERKKQVEVIIEAMG